LCALIKKNMLYLVNLGDSGAFLIRGNQAFKLNKEHKPCYAEEQQKLTMRGALIFDIKNEPRINGELNISRSFGDRSYKNVITSDPDIVKYQINELDKFLILATDGFCDIITPGELEVLLQRWELNPINTVEKLSI